MNLATHFTLNHQREQTLILTAAATKLWPRAYTLYIQPQEQSDYKFIAYLQKYWAQVPITPFYLGNWKTTRPLIHEDQVYFPGNALQNQRVIYTTYLPQRRLIDRLLYLTVDEVLNIVYRLAHMLQELRDQRVDLIIGQLNIEDIILVDDYWPLITNFAYARLNISASNVHIVGQEAGGARSALEDIYHLLLVIIRYYQRKEFVHQTQYVQLYRAVQIFWPQSDLGALANVLTTLADNEFYFTPEQVQIFADVEPRFCIEQWKNDFDLQLRPLDINKLNLVWSRDQLATSKLLASAFANAYKQDPLVKNYGNQQLIRNWQWPLSL